MIAPIKAPKKLIEVALPLDLINVAAARENYIYKGNPSALHKWWAQRPLAAARAVIFAQLVNDPSWRWELEHPGEPVPAHLKGGFSNARRHLFKILEDLVIWENSTNEVVLEKARAEIRKSWRETCEVNKDHPEAKELFDPDKLPGLHDPFAGGGTIPLEAQRLGLEAYASDLNPVAVLINKAMIEIPPKFAGRPPVSSFAPATVGGRNAPGALAGRAAPPSTQTELVLEATSKKGRGKNKAESPAGTAKVWPGATGLAEDLRYYGAWIRAEAEKRIGHLYPPVEVTAAMAKERPDLAPYVGQRLTVMAWLWARTVRSPNPAFSHVEVPLTSTFILSSKQGKEVWVEPVIQGDSWRLEIRVGPPPSKAKSGTKSTSRGANFACLLSNTPISGAYIKAEAEAGRMGARLLAAVGLGTRSRVYLPGTLEMEAVAFSAAPSWQPDIDFYGEALGFRVGNYGMHQWADIFTRRQLAALSEFVEAIDATCGEVAAAIRPRAGDSSSNGGLPPTPSRPDEYRDAIRLYLAFCLSKTLAYSNALTVWYSKEDRPQWMFSRQSVPMVWDFVELNPFSSVGGAFEKSVEIVADSLSGLAPHGLPGRVTQADAREPSPDRRNLIVSTDPPYYDNIGYADLSDYFYVWLRKALRPAYRDVLATVLTPKDQELVATPGRHGGVVGAETFFLDGMSTALGQIAGNMHRAYPVTIYYAFKQAETSSDHSDVTSSGWETFLEAVVRAGLKVSGTWPMRTERSGRVRDNGSNALASSIVLVCRPRPADAPTTSRRAFQRELNQALPLALAAMTEGTDDKGKAHSPVAPVDLSQAIIGPGMAVFSKYAAVLEADGTPMRVKTALQLINRFIGEDDFDHDTQFCLHWFDQFGWNEGAFGEADVLARAKATSVQGLTDAGVIAAGAGRVRLLKPAEYPADWDAAVDARLPVWEVLHQLIRAFRQDGETGAGRILAAEAVKPKTDAARQLAYRLYTLCERRGMADEARAYNEVGTSWDAIELASTTLAPAATPKPRQPNLL